MDKQQNTQNVLLVTDNPVTNALSKVFRIKEILKHIRDKGVTDSIIHEMENDIKLLSADTEETAEIRKLLKTHLSPAEVKQLKVISAFTTLQRQRRQEDARAVNVIFDWVEKNSFTTLQSNLHSRIHKLTDSYSAKQIYPTSVLRGEDKRKHICEILTSLPCFVVKHDWANALSGIFEDKENNVFRLPFPTCLFEFVIEGKCVVTMASEQSDGEIHYLNFIEFEKDKWFEAAENDEGMIKAFKAIQKQIAAICVALGSKIAEHKQVEAVAALNKKRLKNGKTPIKSYHVVDLSARFRDKTKKAVSAQPSERKSPRLHWRHGHWRRIPDKSPIWIEWMLVGNIDLGFVDKHYLI